VHNVIVILSTETLTTLTKQHGKEYAQSLPNLIQLSNINIKKTFNDFTINTNVQFSLLCLLKSQCYFRLYTYRSGQEVSAKVLQEKWKNKKFAAKAAVSRYKACRKTGGGTPPQPPSSGSEKIISIVGDSGMKIVTDLFSH